MQNLNESPMLINLLKRILNNTFGTYLYIFNEEHTHTKMHIERVCGF